jgi:hypothetical protein
MINKCKKCKVEFESPYKRMYCDKCRDTKIADKQKLYYKTYERKNRTSYKHTCGFCGKEFANNSKPQMCCSYKCSWALRRGHDYNPEDIMNDLNNGLTWREIADKNKISVATIRYLLKKNKVRKVVKYV